ncbi:MAG: citrate/2-methylcitrate synthase [Eubacteriales bacterium]|jgi:citrate synthase
MPEENSSISNSRAKAGGYSEMTPKLLKLAEICEANNHINPELYAKHDVKRGLRDADGQGVLTGLTDISTVDATKVVDGVRVPIPGELMYRGINVYDLVGGFLSDGRFGFEETVYLLLFGNLPNKQQLDEFTDMLAEYRTLPTNFVRDVIMKAPNADTMNSLARSVLTLYSYDEYANDLSIPNVLRQSIQLISTMPLLTTYAYQAYSHYIMGRGLFIHNPSRHHSTAENILMLMRDDKSYTEAEAKILDLTLVLHAEHGGGNNSTFTTHVVTSSGTDTYSAIAASLCSLKGPKHGGANIKVRQMFADMMKNIRDYDDDDEIRAYLQRLLNKEAFDRAGLVYGVGHAVYTISDPRAEILKTYVERLSREKGREEEFKLYKNVDRLATEIVNKNKNVLKPMSVNIDFYSGFVYDMLGIPEEMYTPLFAVSRIAGWSAHRIEELINTGKIIRPAYMSVREDRAYIPMSER